MKRESPASGRRLIESSPSRMLTACMTRTRGVPEEHAYVMLCQTRANMACSRVSGYSASLGSCFIASAFVQLFDTHFPIRILQRLFVDRGTLAAYSRCLLQQARHVFRRHCYQGVRGVGLGGVPLHFLFPNSSRGSAIWWAPCVSALRRVSLVTGRCRLRFSPASRCPLSPRLKIATSDNPMLASKPLSDNLCRTEAGRTAPQLLV
ncbi:hypothetical protein SAMN05192543_11233 [Paraburkholderia megapolitana]|uniref:Uncharacterized protein n=1 Tax=Paraburkholderia megapolitana TaxID=420953 RepID=A0A1I3UQC1_9BURK|nr:hypothetical protein SAMN05192543_11233 [Paraburkholderia megapolitana]